MILKTCPLAASTNVTVTVMLAWRSKGGLSGGGGNASAGDMVANSTIAMNNLLHHRGNRIEHFPVGLTRAPIYIGMP
ncbi:MAG: hypothetical protein EOO80_12515 [Oxalobacteraceae bacterium]|nr:MAG: hypothetical protein EOO80_12515 [Oxalobacteraceae bacterium]